MAKEWLLESSEQESLLDFLRRLVMTPSLSGDEGRVAELVMGEMRQLGFDDVWMDAAGNVLGRIGDPTGPMLMLNSHMDVVKISTPESWRFDPWGAEIHDGRLYGRGTCDMKAGLAATVYGAAKLARQKSALKGQVLVACVGLEEPSEGTGTRVLFEEDGIRPAWVVIAEPSNLQIVRAQRGHMEMILTVRGRSAHSSAPHLGENAIYAAARLVFGLELLADQLPEDPFLGPGVLAVTEIRSQAVSRNAIPDLCQLILDRRLTVGETEVLSLNEVQRIIAREGVAAEVRLIEESVQTHTGKVYHVRRASPPWAFDERHPLIRAMVKAAHDVGLRPSLTRWHFATEGAYSAGVAQVPTVGFGPGDPALAHTCDEYVDIDQVYAAAAAYTALGWRLLNK
ncbi:MAG: YgeY family selenium metabolism-linked hydrolase [Anaerolineae bacterium]|nr:YgeY family selenium metabolism-linked hydrolase [Anaerolineae bacterium]